MAQDKIIIDDFEDQDWKTLSNEQWRISTPGTFANIVMDDNSFAEIVYDDSQSSPLACFMYELADAGTPYFEGKYVGALHCPLKTLKYKCDVGDISGLELTYKGSAFDICLIVDNNEYSGFYFHVPPSESFSTFRVGWGDLRRSNWAYQDKLLPEQLTGIRLSFIGSAGETVTTCFDDIAVLVPDLEILLDVILEASDAMSEEPMTAYAEVARGLLQSQLDELSPESDVVGAYVAVEKALADYIMMVDNADAKLLTDFEGGSLSAWSSSDVLSLFFTIANNADLSDENEINPSGQCLQVDVNVADLPLRQTDGIPKTHYGVIDPGSGSTGGLYFSFALFDVLDDAELARSEGIFFLHKGQGVDLQASMSLDDEFHVTVPYSNDWTAYEFTWEEFFQYGTGTASVFDQNQVGELKFYIAGDGDESARIFLDDLRLMGVAGDVTYISGNIGHFAVFPQPIEDLLVVHPYTDGKYAVEIYSSDLKLLIKQETFGKTEINTSALPAGMYIVKLKTASSENCFTIPKL